MRRWLWTIAIATAAVASPVVTTLSAHPLHTSLAEVAYDKRTGDVVVSLRVFVDDFTAASNSYVGKLASNPRGVSPLVTYALSTFSLTEATGRSILLKSCGGKRVGELMWLCFRGKTAPSQKGFKVSSRILFEKYKDQINVVQATVGDRKSNLLFTPGDGDKRFQ